MENLNGFYRDTWVEVNLDAIEHNIKSIKNNLTDDVKIMAAVKANGYGHGAVQVAKTALAAGASYLGVAILDEAIALRKEGITEPILVLGWVRPSDINLAAENDLVLTVFQREWLEEAKKHLKSNLNCVFHLKIDTGMGRIGIRTKNEGKAVIDYINETNQFLLQGVYTHFATSDEKNLDYFQLQYNRFLEMLDWLKAYGVDVPYIHCGNSAATIRFPSKMFTMARVGISMYGLKPSSEMEDEIPFALKEAFSLHSNIIHVKEVNSNEGISYGATYKTKEVEWIATIPIGYADGWLRQNSSCGVVLVDGERCPIVGRVCMDQLMIKLNKKVAVGTKVTLIGEQLEEIISVDEVADRLGTINYEIPCMISYRVPRVYFKNGEIITINNKVF
ncbi:alanine racemase [Anaerobacillus isosaccharinicus]|uniref:Alanine racemase n=1 Tax=Anaerobacillus isosaccharinicus TaxID=1532552 RepID=A0A1S2MG22_9BACI|nr:alanine racemase [Anaerobacillus isosaccharinicus]MBA5588827.1 alanine racemase [Anaerobacillus isosaccharinicus]QOY37782.1 alanine racemase [Anaerobacillus isosaccharinicus]